MNKANSKSARWQIAIIKYFWPFVKSDQGYLILLGAISLVTIVANTLPIWMIGKAITQITNGDFETLNQTLLILAGWNRLVQHGDSIFLYLQLPKSNATLYRLCKRCVIVTNHEPLFSSHF